MTRIGFFGLGRVQPKRNVTRPVSTQYYLCKVFPALQVARWMWVVLCDRGRTLMARDNSFCYYQNPPGLSSLSELQTDRSTLLWRPFRLRIFVCAARHHDGGSRDSRAFHKRSYQKPCHVAHSNVARKSPQVRTSQKKPI